jgi:hypothetical protein
MIVTHFGIRRVPPCPDCWDDGECSMNCGPMMADTGKPKLRWRCRKCMRVFLYDAEATPNFCPYCREPKPKQDRQNPTR